MLHRATVDTDEQGRKFLEAVEKSIEPAVKELSSCLLYPDTPLSQVTAQVRQFEDAIQNLRRPARCPQESRQPCPRRRRATAENVVFW